MLHGSVTAVGVGPGDPELLTLKSLRLIKNADVIVAPAGRKDASSYALSIVEQYIDRNRQKVIESYFPMSRDPEVLADAWGEIAEDVAASALAGEDVVFITIGDPMLYSTFLYILRLIRVKYPEINVDIVPGISSINAAAAVADIPLGLSDEKCAIIPSSVEPAELETILSLFDSLVFLKISRDFDRIIQTVEKSWGNCEGAFVRRVGSKDEEIIYDLDSLKGKELDYLSLLILRKRAL